VIRGGGNDSGGDQGSDRRQRSAFSHHVHHNPEAAARAAALFFRHPAGGDSAAGLHPRRGRSSREVSVWAADDIGFAYPTVRYYDNQREGNSGAIARFSRVTSSG
jgi:hypothetical protein